MERRNVVGFQAARTAALNALPRRNAGGPLRFPVRAPRLTGGRPSALGYRSPSPAHFPRPPR